jgi:hypothetical protein
MRVSGERHRNRRNLHHERKGPARSFASRTRELVVELGVLEVLQLQRQRLLQDHHVDALTQLRAQQRLAQRNAALCAGDCSDQQAFVCDEQQRVSGQSRAIDRIGLNCSDDGIDDQRANICDGRRQRARDQRQNRERNSERAARRPHQFQRAVAVREDTEEAAAKLGLAEKRLALTGIQGR